MFGAHPLKRRMDRRSTRKIERALALNRRGEVRRDGLALIGASRTLEIEWRARTIHPWDADYSSSEPESLFAEQCFADTDAALHRLLIELPDIDEIRFRVIHPESDAQLLAGTVTRTAVSESVAGASPRNRLWHMGVRVSVVILARLLTLLR